MIKTRVNISEYCHIKDLGKCRSEFTCAIRSLKSYIAKAHEIAEDGEWYETEHHWLYSNIDTAKEYLSRAASWRLGRPAEYPIAENLDGKNGTYCKLVDSIDDITEEEQDRICDESGGNGSGMVAIYASSAANAVKLMSYLYHDIVHSNDFSLDEKGDFIHYVSRNFAVMGMGADYLLDVKEDVIRQPALFPTWKRYTCDMLDDVMGLQESVQRDLQEISAAPHPKAEVKVKKKSRQKELARGM